MEDKNLFLQKKRKLSEEKVENEIKENKNIIEMNL